MATIETSEIRPFGERYHKNGGNGRDSACAYCGREVKKPVRWWVEVVDGGGAYVRFGDDKQETARKRSDGASYMGFYPVGPECRKILAADDVIVTEIEGGD